MRTVLLHHDASILVAIGFVFGSCFFFLNPYVFHLSFKLLNTLYTMSFDLLIGPLHKGTGLYKVHFPIQLLQQNQIC